MRDADADADADENCRRDRVPAGMLRLGDDSRGKMERSRFFVKEDLMQGVKKLLLITRPEAQCQSKQPKKPRRKLEVF